VGAAFGAVALPDHAMAGYFQVKERRIALHNLWTEEFLDLAYWRDGDYLVNPLANFAYLLRDWRSGEVGEMFRTIFDQLFWLGRALGKDAPFGIISGFCSASTNDMLSETSEGVAANSLHTYGIATDIRVKDATSERMWQTAVKLSMGGAGLYRSSNFVHLDGGPVRPWGG